MSAAASSPVGTRSCRFFEQAVKGFLVQRFLEKKFVCNKVQFPPMFTKDALGFGVSLVKKLFDFLIDLPCRLLAAVPLPGAIRAI